MNKPAARPQTDENLFVTITNDQQYTFSAMSLQGEKILAGEIPTKWMTPDSCTQYRRFIDLHTPYLKHELQQDPNSRRLALHGPTGACWMSSHLISTSPGEYTLVAVYRSMDVEHTWADMSIQAYIAERILDTTPFELTELKLLITSYHRYK